ncbi:MAG: hypothetical protein MZV65_34705 [Chromatiales bacterium]|nr:hypothetical protein [Chromatiales bacterium]
MRSPSCADAAFALAGRSRCRHAPPTTSSASTCSTRPSSGCCPRISGRALSYKAVLPAEPLGVTGFDLGVAVDRGPT